MKHRQMKLKRVISNNMYMLGLINKSSVFLIPFSLMLSVIRGINTFFMTTYLYRYVLNALQIGEKTSNIVLNVSGMFLSMAVYVILRQIRQLYAEIEAYKVEKYIQTILQEKVLKIEISCFEDPEFYNDYVKALSETSGRAIKVLNDLCEFLVTAITIFSIGYLIASINLIFIILAFIPLVATLCLGEKRTAMKYEMDMHNKGVERKKEYVRRVFYSANFAKEMRLSQMYIILLKRMKDCVQELKNIAKEYGYKLMWFELFFSFLFEVIVYAGSIVIAVYKTLVKSSLLLGDCFVVINSITNISYSINSVGDTLVAFRENSKYIENLRFFLDYREQIIENPNGYIGEHKTLELKNVSFSYDGQSGFALKNICMSINSGEKIAIVGYNGSGKSTLVKLLLRYYDPIEGEIMFNDHDLRDCSLTPYRDIIGTVFQDYHLFAVSVAENVLMNRETSTRQKDIVQNALQKSGIYDKIKSLPQGIDTLVTKEFDSNGVVLSGGEEQKIAIARIIARAPQIVILDEPSSALDPIAEGEMYRNIFEACQDKTVIFISHRLSSVTMADKIYMLDKGEIIEQGTHVELLEKKGKYAEMWHKQAEKYVGKDPIA